MNSDQMVRDSFGKDYEKSLKAANKAKMDAKARFLGKYPYADMTKFRIFVTQEKNGKIRSTDIDYVIDDVTLVGISTDTFKNNPEWVASLGWPIPRGVGGEVQDFEVGSWSKPPNEVEVYVAKDLYFDANLEALDIATSESNDFKENSYLPTYLCGISTEHLEYRDSVLKVVTSIVRYHLYYQMARFLKKPAKMSRYITADITKIIMDNKPTKGVWKNREFHQGQENLGTWLSKWPRGIIRNAKQVFSQYGGQVGIRYDKRIGKTIVGLDDYKTFIASKSEGLTKLGELLLQQSMESYVYCVLGAQAKTKWSIVGYGARSLQTQEVFRKLVGETVLQVDHTAILSNMRGAIKPTNVVLNMAISPGLILVPSNMIILDKMIPGYNNVLTTAKSGMKFGRNNGTNYFAHDTIRQVIPKAALEAGDAVGTSALKRRIFRSPPEEDNNWVNFYAFLIATFLGAGGVWMW